MKKLLLLLILLVAGSHIAAEAQKKHRSTSSVPPINISGKLFGGLLGFPGGEVTHWIELDFGTQNFTLDIFEDCLKGTYKTKGNVVTLFNGAGGEFGKLSFQKGDHSLRASMKGDMALWVIEWPKNLKKFDASEEQILDQIVKNNTYDCVMIVDSNEGKLGIRGTVRFTRDKSYWNFDNSLMEGKYEKERTFEISGSNIILQDETGLVYNNANFIEINNGEGWFPSLGKVRTTTYLIK